MDKIDHQDFETALKACMKALADNKNLLAQYSDQVDNAPFRFLEELKALTMPLPSQKKGKIRGEADAFSLFDRYHDAHLFHQEVPSQADIRPYFLMLEKMRCHLLGSQSMKGVQKNLSSYYQVKSHVEVKAGQTHAPHSILLNLPIVLLSAASSIALSQKRKESIRDMDPVQRTILLDLSQKLLEQIGNQQKFQETLLAFFEDQGLIVSNVQKDEPEEIEEENPQRQEKKDHSILRQNHQKFMLSHRSPGQKTVDPGEEALDFEIDTIQESAEPSSEKSSEERQSFFTKRKANSDDLLFPNYAVYTREFDLTQHAEELIAPLELDRLRDALDQQLQSYKNLTTRLANKLQRKLLAKQKRAWDYNLDEGVLDTFRLSRIIMDPVSHRAFKKEKVDPFKDTVVTLLIDNSGSMRGKPIATAAISADILARTLERCDIKTEVLGFTTSAWKGGKARDLWASQHKPTPPGRLNDLLQIIYKGADSSWRKSRKNLGLMLKEGLLKENIDGEALLWAYHRLEGRPEERKILMVISDGAPVDDSTQSVNPNHYLEAHLKEVIAYIENMTNIELVAIGIGHDVTSYYKRAVTIIDSEELSHTILTKLEELFNL